MKTYSNIIIAILLAVPVLASAQNPPEVTTGDTIPGYYQRYWYTDWYTNSHCWDDNIGFYTSIMGTLARPDGSIEGWILKTEYTPRPMAVKGLVALIAFQDSTAWTPNWQRNWETMEIYQGTNATWETLGDTMYFLDSVRWDTVTPHVMRLPTKKYGTSVSYCYAYEAYFKAPVWVDSFFHITGSGRSNISNIQHPEHPNWDSGCEWYKPTKWLTVHDALQCFPVNKHYWRILDSGVWEHGGGWVAQESWGYFLAIVDNHELRVETADSTMGTATGSGMYPEQTWVEIEAVPSEGYVFWRWSDGNLENPRTVTVMCDTTYTAYFKEPEYFELRLAANDTAWGTVEGAGLYLEQEPVVITATPATGCEFEQWDDGEWQNPRTVRLRSDTLFTAVFSKYEGIDAAQQPALTLTPNPTRDRVRVDCGEPMLHLALHDLGGRTVLEARPMGESTDLNVSRLAAGTYLLTATTARGTVTGKLKIEN